VWAVGAAMVTAFFRITASVRAEDR
jgi:hypothetical protein